MQTEQSQEQVVGMLRSRNVKALGLLFDQYGSVMFSMIYRITKDKRQTEKLLFKTFTYVWNHFSSYDSTRQSIGLWLIEISCKLTLESLSSHAREILEMKLLEKLRASDSGREISVLELVYFHKISVDKIAETLECSMQDVRTLLHQGIVQLTHITIS